MEDRPFSPPTRAWLESGKLIELCGHRVFTYERGTGPCVLLLHGFPTSSYDWRGLIDRLADRYHCVALDLIGLGLSDKPEAFGYSLFQQADLVEALARARSITRAHVVSHDMGASVHCELLARRRERRLGFAIKSSTIYNASLLQWMAHLTPLQQLWAANESLPQAMELAQGDLSTMYLGALQALMQRPEQLTDDDKVVMDELLQYQQGHLRLAAIASYIRERYLHRDRWLGALAQNDVPLHLAWANGDPIAHAEMGRELARRLPHARHTELAGLGHFPMVEAPETAAQALKTLLNV